ncbi:MAG: hypothetical protein GXP14_17495 [Gammaproteobacteria bacterium]|nr:hypothetical protein [Gammaproteobacteria bacterium]
MYSYQQILQNSVVLPLNMIKVPIENTTDPEYEAPALGPEGEVEPLEPVENEPSPEPKEGEESVPPSPVTP